MAQVRKFKEGGLSVNGKLYTPQQVNDYLNDIGMAPERRAALAQAINNMESGKQYGLDRNANQFIGENVQDAFNDFYGNGNDKKGERKAKRNVGKSARWARLQSTLGSKHDILNNAIHDLGGIEDYYKNKNKEEEKPESKLGMGSGWFTNEKGEYEDTPTNLAKEKLIKQVYEHLSGTKKYDLADGWGTNMDVLSNWYKEGMNAEDLIDAIKSGNLEADQLDALRLMGFTQSDLSKAQSDEAKVKKAFTNAGYDYDKFRPYFDINDKGRLIARTTADGQSVFSQLGGSGNYYFNDSFANAYKQYDFLKDHFLIDGKLYKSSDAGVEGSDLYNFLRSSNGFYDLNKKGDWEGANKLITHLWNGETNNALASDMTDTYSKFLYDNPTYRWASLTGAYDVPLAKGEQLLEIYDPSGNVDMFGYGTAKYAVLDEDGNLLRYIDSIGNPTGKSASVLTGRKVARTESGNTIFDGLIVNDVTDSKDEYTGKTYFQDPKTGDFIYKGRVRGASGLDGQFIKVPHEISDILNTNPNFWKNLASNQTLQKRFESNMGDLVNSGISALFNDVLSEDEWISLGFTKPGQASNLVRLFEEYSKNKHAGDRIDRRQKRLVNQERILKNGGLIAAKFAPGGTVKSIETKSHTARKVNSEFRNSENLARLGKDSFTGQDWAELVALGTDIGAIVAGATGAPIVSGVIGATGSLTSFGADVSRDGLDWGDVGSLVTNLGLDAVSLLPVAGTIGQSGKVVKAIRKSAPIVLKALALAGVGDATVTAAKKIINGEDWNIRDVRNVTNALSGVLALKKTGLFNNGTKNIKGEAKTIAIDKKDLEGLSETTLKKKLADELGVKPEDIKSHTSSVEQKRGLKFWKGKQPTGKEVFKVQLKEDVPQIDLNTWRGQKTRYNDWLKTGEWVDNYIVSPGRVERMVDIPVSRARMINPSRIKSMPIEVGGSEVYRVLSSARPATMRTFGKPLGISTPRSILRQASVYVPNLIVGEDDRVTELPEWYSAAPAAEYVRERFKEGGKVTKFQYPAGTMPKPKLNLNLNTFGRSQDDIMTYGYTSKYSPTRFNYMTGQTESNPEYQSALQIPKIKTTPLFTSETKSPEVKTEVEDPSKSRLGSQISEKARDWKKIEAVSNNLGKIAMEAALTDIGINSQVNRAYKNNETLHNVHNIIIPEHYESFFDGGKKSAYDQAALEVENQASQDISSDPIKNRLFKRQAAAQARLHRLQGRLAQSQDYSAFRQRNLERRVNYAAQRVANLNEDIKRHAQADIALQMELGKADALKVDMAKKAIGDLTGIYNKSKLTGLQSDLTQETRNYQDWYNTEKAKYDAGIKAGTISGTDYSTFDKYITGNKSLLDEQRRRYDTISGIKTRAALYQKKGGRIRPTSEQIKIDTEKAKHKAIAQLSKQAFELLKMALK